MGHRMRRIVLGSSAALLLVGVLAGCDEGTDVGEDTGNGADADVDDGDDGEGDDGDGDDAVGAALTIAGSAFDPASLEVTAGETIEVVNEDGVAHTVTADDGTFDERVDGGGSTTFAVDEPGTYPYVCSIHASMTGELTVTE